MCVRNKRPKQSKKITTHESFKSIINYRYERNSKVKERKKERKKEKKERERGRER